MLRSSDFNPDKQEPKLGSIIGKLITAHDIQMEKLRRKNAAQGLDILGDPLPKPVEIPKEGEK